MLNISLSWQVCIGTSRKCSLSQLFLFTVNEPLERRTHCGSYLLIVYPGLDWFTWIYCVQCLTGAPGSGFRVFIHKETDSTAAWWIHPKRQKHKKTLITEDDGNCHQYERFNMMYLLQTTPTSISPPCPPPLRSCCRTFFYRISCFYRICYGIP